MLQDIDKVTVTVEDISSENLVFSEEESFETFISDEDKLLLTMSDTDEMTIMLSDLLVLNMGEDIVKQMIVGTEFIDAFRAVYQDSSGKIYLYSTDNINLIGKFVGITLELGNPDEVVSVKITGEVSNSQWNFGIGTNVIYAGVAGLVVTTEAQSAVFTHELGISLASDKFLIDPKLAEKPDNIIDGGIF